MFVCDRFGTYQGGYDIDRNTHIAHTAINDRIQGNHVIEANGNDVYASLVLHSNRLLVGKRRVGGWDRRRRFGTCDKISKYPPQSPPSSIRTVHPPLFIPFPFP